MRGLVPGKFSKLHLKIRTFVHSESKFQLSFFQIFQIGQSLDYNQVNVVVYIPKSQCIEPIFLHARM